MHSPGYPDVEILSAAEFSPPFRPANSATAARMNADAPHLRPCDDLRVVLKAGANCFLGIASRDFRRIARWECLFQLLIELAV